MREHAPKGTLTALQALITTACGAIEKGSPCNVRVGLPMTFEPGLGWVDAEAGIIMHFKSDNMVSFAFESTIPSSTPHPSHLWTMGW